MITIATLALATSLSVIDSIRIQSRWGGLGEPRAASYTILRRGDHYERLSSPVPQGAVDHFLAAITSPPVNRKTAVRGLVTHEWLVARLREAHDNASVPVCSPDAKRLFEKHLADPQEALGALDHYFSGGWTDDFPFISVDVLFHDGRTMHLESRQQPVLMLPWKVDKVNTWNPEIPRAILSLIPNGAEQRLNDENLAAAYVEEVVSDTSRDFEEIEERCVHHDFLKTVENQFEIVRVYHGSPGWFTAYVRRADFPENLVLTLVIRDDGKPDAQAKLYRTVQRSWAYVKLARKYVRKHPKRHFAIWCADGISVEGNDGAIRISDYDSGSGIVSNPRIILPDGSVTQDR